MSEARNRIEHDGSTSPERIKQTVGTRCAETALRVLQGGPGCCGSGTIKDPVGADFYDATDAATVPVEAL